MSNSTFDLDNFNPDSMSLSEVSDWMDHFSEAEASETNEEKAQVFNVLFQYCKSKEGAMTARMAGDIKLALFLEGVCDDIYASIPADYKW